MAWPLVGREAELRFVAEALADDGAGGVVLVGPPGVGKTRLAHEAAAHADASGCTVEWVRATRSAASIPLGAFAPLLPAVDFPKGIGELEKAELHPVASVEVKPPRIAEAPVSFECKRITGLSLGACSTLEVGRVIHIHIRDDLVDPERFYVQTDKMRLVGRMHGRGWYARTSDLFLMDRISLAEWKDGKR